MQRRADNMKDRSGKQQLLTDGKPFGEPLKEFLIKPVPYSDLLNNSILYTIEFYATYTTVISLSPLEAVLCCGKHLDFILKVLFIGPEDEIMEWEM